MKKRSILILYYLYFIQASIIAQVGINTETPNPENYDNVGLDINGKLIVRDLDQVSDDNSTLTQVGVDENGVFVKMSSLVSLLAFYQSSTGTKYTDATIVNSLNAGTLFLIPWNASDEIINTDMITFNSTENSFVFKHNGLYDISGVLNFGVNMGSSFVAQFSSRVAINLTIQYAKFGSSSWVDLANTRVIYTGGELINDYVAKTIITPPTLFEFDPGDRIRLIVKKPFGSTLTAFEISKPTGSTISKQIKIVRM